MLPYIVISLFYKENLTVMKHFLLEKETPCSINIISKACHRGHNNLELVDILTNFSPTKRET